MFNPLSKHSRFAHTVLLAAIGEALESAGAGGVNAKARAEAEQVTMKDGSGRIVEFAGKRKLLKEDVSQEGQAPQVRFDFRNGESRTFTVPQELMAKFAAHGASQKIGDTCAGLDNVDDMVVAVDEAIDRLYNLNWGAVREGGGLAGGSILLRALGEAYSNRTADQLKHFLAGKSQAEKIALRNSEKLKPIIARIEAEKAAKAGSKVDADALLAELKGDAPLGESGSDNTGAAQLLDDQGDGGDTGDGGNDSGGTSNDDADGMAHQSAGPDVYGDADAGKTGGKKGKPKGGKTTEVNPA